jgi:hypothetical protein
VIRRARAAGGELLGLFVSGWVETAITLVLIGAALAGARAEHGAWVGFALAGALSVELLVLSARGRTPR